MEAAAATCDNVLRTWATVMGSNTTQPHMLCAVQNPASFTGYLQPYLVSKLMELLFHDNMHP